jgi:hypothetical protein
MNKHPKTKLTLVAEAALEPRLLAELKRHHAHAWTISEVRGAFPEGDREGDWEADRTESVAGSNQTIYLWIVPAKVEGRWQTAGGELTLVQAFQQVSGTLQHNGTSAAITDGRLRGAELRMTIDGAQYAGRVNGNTIEGTVTTSGKTVPWKATRAGA